MNEYSRAKVQYVNCMKRHFCKKKIVSETNNYHYFCLKMKKFCPFSCIFQLFYLILQQNYYVSMLCPDKKTVLFLID